MTDERDDRPVDPRDEEGPPEEETPRARVHVPSWSPWLWIIPAAVLIFVGWLVVKWGFFGGGDITVRFPEAAGLERYSPVRFRGAKVGSVQKITIGDDLREIVVRISMDASMQHALREGTRFWIVKPGLSGGGIGGLLSGTYVALAPGPGEETRSFEGQLYPAILDPPEPGTTVLLETDSLGALSIGSPIKLDGMTVGQVLGAEHDIAERSAVVHAYVVERFADSLRVGSRFWRAGGVSVSMGGGGLSVEGLSLDSLVGGGVEFLTPELLAGPPAPDGARFELYDSRAEAVAAAEGPHVAYLTYFSGPVGGLGPGTPVKMRGIEVGHVVDVRLRYNAAAASLETPVLLEIDPRVLELDLGASPTAQELRSRMDEALTALVRRGMRATLSTSLVLPGASAVSLQMVAPPGTATLVLTSDPPTIPAAAGGDGLAGALDSVDQVARTISNLPLQEIAGDLRSAARRVDALVSDPQLDESLRSLRRASDQIEEAAATANQSIGPISESLRAAADSAQAAGEAVGRTAAAAEANVEPIAESLRNAAGSAEAAAARIEELAGTSTRQNYGLAELVEELTRAAEAVRSLAAYLTENPDSLVKGRPE